ncbi:hypothetical protein SASPL_112054 [Salvia splendens]|uniref:Uncharacterized protein n=1 Tax=Salvia splendens TaxID=180675 RepID=A0A8X8YBX2_SALSN|nr:hypothetical protein SASPL_112054 [Salvia splendens]
MGGKRAEFGTSETQVNACSRRPTTDRTRCSWCDLEEKILVVTLKDLATQGWKSDNNFRVGCLDAEMEFDLGGNGVAGEQPSANLEDMSASGVGYGTEELVEDNTSLSEGGSYGSGKKRKTSGGSSTSGKTNTNIDGLVHLLTKLYEDTNDRIQSLSLRIGYEFDLIKARK